MSTKKVYNYSNIITIVVIIIIGLVLMLGGQAVSNTFWQSFINNIGAAVLISGVFSAINEYFMKEKLVSLILTKIKLREDIDRTGIEKVHHNIGDIDYGYYLKQAKNRIDIFHVYGRTWTNMNSDELTDIYKNTNCKIRVILLSPESDFVPALAATYGISTEELKERINEVTKTWESIYAKKNRNAKKATMGDIELYYHDTQPAHSLYRIDDRVIIVQNKITSGKSKKLPTIVCKDTSKPDDLYNYYIGELDSLVIDSKKQNLVKGD